MELHGSVLVLLCVWLLQWILQLIHSSKKNYQAIKELLKQNILVMIIHFISFFFSSKHKAILAVKH